jgi:hypothetical protein
VGTRNNGTDLLEFRRIVPEQLVALFRVSRHHLVLTFGRIRGRPHGYGASGCDPCAEKKNGTGSSA